jgi:hypothetical protein
MPFTLKDWTAARIEDITVRTERHGPDEVTAISLHLKFSGMNTLLDLVSKTLREALYLPPDEETLPGVEQVRTRLRSTDIAGLTLPLKKVPTIEGGTVFIDYGLGGEDAPITMGKTKVDAFRAIVLEGGSASLLVRVGSNDVSTAEIGQLAGKLHQEVRVRIEPPAPVTEPVHTGQVIDGTRGPGLPFDDPDAQTPEKALAEAVEKPAPARGRGRKAVAA